MWGKPPGGVGVYEPRGGLPSVVLQTGPAGTAPALAAMCCATTTGAGARLGSAAGARTAAAAAKVVGASAAGATVTGAGATVRVGAVLLGVGTAATWAGAAATGAGATAAGAGVTTVGASGATEAGVVTVVGTVAYWLAVSVGQSCPYLGLRWGLRCLRRWCGGAWAGIRVSDMRKRRWRSHRHVRFLSQVRRL